MFHVVFLDSADGAYVAAEVEAVDLIWSHIPEAVFTPWRGPTMRVYQDE
jgi:hypothetical protein